jgi:ribosomal protein L11 methyltransferase
VVSETDAPTTWLQLCFTCDAATAARIAEDLDACGALAVSLDDAQDEPLYEPEPGTTPLWSRTRVSGLFAGGRRPEPLLKELARRHAPEHLPEANVETLEDKDWLRLHREGFEPTCFGARLWVVPSWSETPPVTRGQVSMVMDPGLAFGTGSHPTTAMCLAWLAGECLAAREVVDYGCGSGVLAVAATKLGASRVWAVDNDPQALEATRENAAANGVSAQVAVREPGDLPPLTAQLVVSNILANTLSTLAETLSKLLQPGGRLALAGILKHQSAGVIARFAPWCDLAPAAERDDWVLLAGTRRTHGER